MPRSRQGDRNLQILHFAKKLWVQNDPATVLATTNIVQINGALIMARSNLVHTFWSIIYWCRHFSCPHFMNYIVHNLCSAAEKKRLSSCYFLECTLSICITMWVFLLNTHKCVWNKVYIWQCFMWTYKYMIHRCIWLHIRSQMK